VTYEGERSLLTCPDTNVRAGEIFEGNREKIISLLNRTRHVHVTSFFDDRTPHVVYSIIKEARACNPYLKCSFDPGFRWVTTQKDFVIELARLVDVVFLNSHEFSALFGEDEQEASISLRKTLESGPKHQRVFQKSKTFTRVYRRFNDKIMSSTCYHSALRDCEVIDDTGAGDVFAGAIIGAELANLPLITASVPLAVDLAKAKLKVLGQEFESFGKIVQSQI